METHVFLKNSILSSLGDGFVKLILGAPGAGKSFFLSHDLFLALSEEAGNKIVSISPSTFEGASALLKQKEGCTRLVVLADDVFSFPHPESLFEAFAGKGDVDLIASSSFSPDYALGEDETLIRGRFKRFYFSPLSYEESLGLGRAKDLDEYIAKGGLFLSKEACLEKALKEGASFRRFRKDSFSKALFLLDLLGAHLDEGISYSRLSELSGGKLNHITLQSYLDFLEGCFLLFSLDRENPSNGRVKKRESIYYLGDVALQKNHGGPGSKAKSLILMKLFEQSFSSRSLCVYARRDGGWGTIELGYALERGREKIYLSYSLGSGAEESKAMARFLRDSFPKVVVVPFATSPWRDEAGIVHVGLSKFLLSGIGEIIGG